MNVINKILSVAMIAASFLLLGCSDKEDVSPSNADADRLETLLDRSIPDVADFCDKYGTYVLYKFDQRLDFAYQFEQATAWDNAKLTMLDHDEAAEAMTWLKNNVFSHYNDAFKTKYLPRKFLITKKIESTSELGRSIPKDGLHAAVANINSITVGNFSNSQDIDRVILSDYLVNARGEAPVSNEFYEVSNTYYSTLMDDNRRQAHTLLESNPEFFHDYGFLNPADDDATYFPSARLDLVQYIDSLVGMTQDLHDKIMNNENTDMLVKMAYVAHGLKSIGVDVAELNPYAVDFLEVNISGINPGVRFNSIPAAFSAEENIEFTVLRGENNLQKAEVYMHGELIQTFDLTSQSDAPAIKLSATLKGLKPKSNLFTVWVYEEGKTRPSAKVSSTITYYANNSVLLLNIQDDASNSYTRENYNLEVAYNDNVIEGITKMKDIITVTFYHKAKFDASTFMEYGHEKRYWRMHFCNGKVDWIEEYENVINYEEFTASDVYRHKYIYSYDEDGNLEKVEKEMDGNKQTIVSDVETINEEIVSYNVLVNGSMICYKPKYSLLDNKTRIDLQDANLSGASFVHEGGEEENPYYIAGLPAVLPGEVADLSLNFLYNPYLFNAINDAEDNCIWNGGWKINRSDPKNPYIGATVTRGKKTWYYRYILK